MTKLPDMPELRRIANPFAEQPPRETAPQPEPDRDIVARLRGPLPQVPAEDWHEPGYDYTDHVALDAMLKEAAAEIERLRAELDERLAECRRLWEIEYRYNHGEGP